MKLVKTSNSKMMKIINQQKVLRLIYTEGPIARVELAERIGLTQQTITNIVNRLLKDDVILETNGTSSGGGRKPIPLIINSRNMYAIGIEIAVQYVRGSLMDFENNTIKEVTEFVPRYESEEHPLEYIDKVVNELRAFIPDQLNLKGIGCSIQGLVDSQKGMVIYSPGMSWRNFPLQEKLRQKHGIPVHLQNDANLLALVENLNGALAMSDQNLTFKFDYGIGGATVVNNQLIHGSNHVAGEFGHYKAFSGDDAYPCHCGSKGCLTTLASESGLKRNVGYTLEEFAARVRARDPEAIDLFIKIEDAISRAIANLITFFNPDYVLLTGRLIDQMADVVVPLLKEHIMEMLPHSCQGVTILQLPKTPDESRSAAGLVMNNFFDIPFNHFY